MEELSVKKDFTNIYTQNSPRMYLQEMKRLCYRIANSTKPLYLSLAKQLLTKLKRPVNILDLGSSYGINAALMKHDITMSELDDFFLNKIDYAKEDAKQFYDDLPKNNSLNFYQIDISKPALKFSEDMGLCKKGICVNLDNERMDPTSELSQIDMIIATGCIGYIGHMAFANLLETIKKIQSPYVKSEIEYITPIFAFSVLRIFDMKKIQQTFDYYGYSIVKSDLEPIPQRNFSDYDEKLKTISLLHNKGIDTKEYEDKGKFYADFYVASPKKLENQLASLTKTMEKQSNFIKSANA